MNLLEESMECLRVLKVDEEDIYGVYDGKTFLDWNDFKELARDVNYYNGFGGQEINQSLLIYTKSAILYRHEYDGAEDWRYIPILNKDVLLNPNRYEEINPLFKNVKFIIKNEFNFPNDEYIDRYDYEEFLDYKGGYII